ncbi:MAG: alpha-mannosidase [Ruminococcaceae bacterium]|nr:alpha-mannosidase [Oscillospiraceae bacterium]
MSANVQQTIFNTYSLDRIRINIDHLGNQHTVTVAPVELYYRKADGYKGNTPPPTEGYEPFAPGIVLTEEDAHYWFRATFRTPAAEEHKQYLLRFEVWRESWDDVPQGLLYLNGKKVLGTDMNHTEVTLEPDTEYEMYNYFYGGLLGIKMRPSAKIVKKDPRIEQLWYDLRVPFEALKTVRTEELAYQQVMTVLEQATVLLDLRRPYSDEYYDSLAKAQKMVTEELYDKLCSAEGKPIVNCLGHTHIDVEWRWTRAQTIEKIERSFTTAATLMEQYPEYRFMLSQPELYMYLKEQAPEKYEELKKLVAEGRWEPEGAMFLEADCNLVSGESFVRQLLMGKTFFKDEFGIDSRILFLPDVFGYSCALPQILKKSGVDYFVTSKISWNDTNTLPFDSFMWQGLDGTEIFTNFITTQNYSFGNGGNETTYVGMLTPTQVHGTWKRFQQKEYNDRTLTTFGHGDGGGGPTAEMLETYRRLAKGLPGMPVTVQEFLLPHLQKVEENFKDGCRRTGRIPRWVGELYLEYHRGTYTSMAKNKRGNRVSEFLLGKAESLSCLAEQVGQPYDHATIQAGWRKVLHNQFHDIIPGSSIKQVYDGTDVDYAEIAADTGRIIDGSLQAIAANVDGQGVLVYNPSGFDRNGIVRVDGTVCEVADTIPAHGWRVLPSVNADCTVKVDGLTAESDLYILTLDAAGRITRLYDKQNGREVFKAGEYGNELQIFEDYPRMYDNWEISEYYRDKMYVMDTPATIEPFTDGSSAGFKVTRQYMDSTLCQTIRLYSHSRRVDIENDYDWHQHHQVLKIAFPYDVHATAATYEIQFGHVTRPTHHNTSWEASKFECYGHKWVDMSEHGYGVALLNDCKYGYSAEGSTLKVTALKCGSYPNPEADQGRHLFTVSLLPHAGGFREGGVMQEAYALNQPMEAVTASGTGNVLPATYSMVSADKENIFVDTVKKAQADDGVVIRLYDGYDRREQVTLTVAPGFTKAYLCNMMEQELEELSFDGSTLTLPVNNFEIVTLKLTR